MNQINGSEALASQNNSGTKVPPPKQGYKQTKVGIIPEDWEVVKLESISDFITKGATPTTYGFNWQEDGIPFLRSECVSDNGLNLKAAMYICQDAHSVMKRSSISSGDILMTITGNVGRVVLLENFHEGNINQHIARIRIIEEIANKNFIFSFLSQSTYQLNYSKITTGQAYPQLSLVQVRDSLVPLPPLKEQEKIAEILTTWDEAITKQEELIKAKELQKKALMQKLLSGEVRFDGFNDEWKTFSLYEVLKERKTYQSKGLELEHVSLTKEGVVPKSERYERDFLVKEEDKQYKITKLNDICYNPANLKFGVICKNTYGDGIFSPIYVTFETKKGFDIDFLGYFLTWNDFIQKVRKFEEGTVYERMAVNPKDFLSFKTKLPSLLEQQKIAEVLSLADDEINLLKNELEELKQQKKALMQKLLTGQVRVKV